MTSSPDNPIGPAGPIGPAQQGGPGDQWHEVEAALQEAMGYPTRARPAKRERVVLAERRSSRRVVRTLAEVEELTGVGEVLLRQLMRTQLKIAIRLMVLTAVVLGSIPMVLLLVSSLGAAGIVVAGLAWLLSGLAVYPFLIAVAWTYNRRADHNEQEFTEMVEN